MRLIDADAEIERLKKGYCEECTRKGNYGIFGAACTPCWVKDAIEEFDNAQTVEAEPVRHGRWDEEQCFSEHGIPMASYECTNCGNDIERQRGVVPAYCEFCGAKMDGGADSAG